MRRTLALAAMRTLATVTVTTLALAVALTTARTLATVPMSTPALAIAGTPRTLATVTMTTPALAESGPLSFVLLRLAATATLLLLFPLLLLLCLRYSLLLLLRRLGLRQTGLIQLIQLSDCRCHLGVDQVEIQVDVNVVLVGVSAARGEQRHQVLGRLQLLELGETVQREHLVLLALGGVGRERRVRPGDSGVPLLLVELLLLALVSAAVQTAALAAGATRERGTGQLLSLRERQLGLRTGRRGGGGGGGGGVRTRGGCTGVHIH
mmetsp:Transcript_35569/g.89371  ORF Transcript_35569/g.89371 Transcript_35569/m.89371 type:complete len:265 (+) Transcript_35569:658-1452(+)